MLRPGRRQPAAVIEVFIQVDQAVKNQVVDRTAGGIGAQNGVEDLRVRRRTVNVFGETLRISLGLFIVGGNPEKRLNQEGGDPDGKKYENPFDKHTKILSN